MGICVRRFNAVASGALATIRTGLAAYYLRSPTSYYATANCAAEQYSQDIQPFHCDLVSRVRPGNSVLEVGCGTAHLCRFVEAAGGLYAGIDHGVALLADNRMRFPNARFFAVGGNLRETFDIVASLYTIEHVVDPLAYLEGLWSFVIQAG